MKGLHDASHLWSTFYLELTLLFNLKANSYVGHGLQSKSFYLSPLLNYGSSKC